MIPKYILLCMFVIIHAVNFEVLVILIKLVSLTMVKISKDNTMSSKLMIAHHRERQASLR